MKKSISSELILRFLIIVLILGVGPYRLAFSLNQDTLLVHYNVYQCDSLIQANANNPEFIILDVRTPAEHNPQHLMGAINRNFYQSNFYQLINALPKHKMYLIHCRSGARSGNTFNMMLGMNFTWVVDMLGGTNAWNAASLPTTSSFAPLLMAISDTMIAMDTITIGSIDTIVLTITNRANDTLQFNSLSSLSGTEFTTDFDTNTKLLGAEDYTFSVFYEPIDDNSDTLNFLIESNGGDLAFHIQRSGRSLIRVFNKVFLQGAYAGNGMMNTLICQTGSFPITQPFNTFPWNYTGPEQLTSVPTNIVDWVLIEIRDSSDVSLVHVRRAGLLLDNGQIADTDLSSGIVLNNIGPGYYHVAIYHLNHLPLMTADPVMLQNTSAIDFSDTTLTPFYGTAINSSIELESNVYGMIGGDINRDGTIKYSGPGNDRGLILQRIINESGSTSITTSLSGYYEEDIKLDGGLRYSGPENDPSLIIQNLFNLNNSTSFTSTFSTPVPVGVVNITNTLKK